MTFLILFFAHLLADFPLQGEFLALNKGKNVYILFVHAGIWTGVICITGFFMGFTITYFDILLLFFVHAIADYMKANGLGPYKKLKVDQGGLWLDQSIHVLQLILFLLMQ